MDPIATYAPGDEFPSADQNTFQARAEGALRANASSNDLSAMRPGTDSRTWQTKSAGLASHTLATIADDLDYRDRIVVIHWVAFGGSTQIIGGAADDVDYSTLTTGTQTGYLGTGALDAAHATVTNGNPPVIPGSPQSYGVRIQANEYVYCDPSTGVLKFYNNTGSTIFRLLVIRTYAATGKH